MSSSRERAFQLARVEQQLQKISTTVWEQPEFPAAHRPDIATLKRAGKLRIGKPRQHLTMHPHLKPEIVKELQAHEKRHQIFKSLAIPSWYDYYLGETTFSPDIVGLSDLKLGSFIAHEAAHSMIPVLRITPDQYTEEQAERISDTLTEWFMPTRPKTLNQSEVVKVGFRETLEVEGRYVTNLTGPDVTYLDEVYATAFELITDQIARRNGNIAAFDRDVSLGQIQLTDIDSGDHPTFTLRLFQALQFIDWRHVLDAFKTGDLHETIKILSHHIKTQKGPFSRFQKPAAEGSGIFMALFEAMKEDEERIDAAVARFLE